MKCLQLLIFLICPLLVRGQFNTAKKNTLQQLIGLDFEEAKQILSDNYEIKSAAALYRIMYHKGQKKSLDSITVNKLETPLDDHDKIIFNLVKGFYLINNEKRNSAALDFFLEAYSLAKTFDESEARKLSLIGIIELNLTQVVSNTDDFKKYIIELKAIATTKYDHQIALYLEALFYAKSIYSPSEFFGASERLIDIENTEELTPSMQGLYLELIAVYFRAKQNEEGIISYNKKIINLKDTPFNINLKRHAYLELAALDAKNQNVLGAKRNIVNAKKFVNKSDSLRSIYTIDRFKSIYVHAPLREFDSAYYLLHDALIYEADQDFKENKEKISELEVELQTAEKEKQIILEQEENKRVSQIAYGLGGAAGLIALVGFLLFKNTKRKQRIAEQERELEIREKEAILKEQELTTIDAMIAGQEKERQRLASDLHDSVGATLSAAKLQFDHIAKNREKTAELDELFSKTGQLLEDAYSEVRSMAHIKNSGVIAKEGLLPAVEKLAKNASSNGGLQIVVEDFGLTERLENSLEISIFRIIQELVTNVIKHAQASEATISITQHEDSINIIVEDNGKGFASKQLPKKDGMGLLSIEKRVEHLEGSMEVDSTLGKGTNVLIDIPL